MNTSKLSFKKEIGLIIVGAIIFIASFMWKDLFKDVEEKYFPKEYGLTGRFIFTILVTIILVLSAVYLKNIWNLSQSSQPTNTVRFDDEPLGSGDNSDLE